MAPRSQPYRIEWPLNAEQARNIDDCFQILFDDIRNGALIIDLSTQVTGTLGVTHGGTGTPTAFTAGSVVFAGASGVYNQNNSKFFWDNTNLSLNVTGRGWFTGTGNFPVMILAPVDASDSHPPFIVKRYNDDKANLFIDASGDLNLNAGIRLCGNRPYMGTVGADGSFTPVAGGAVATGISSMIDMYGDTTVVIASRTSSAGGAYNSQFLDASGNYVLSIEADGSLQWGTGASHAAQDTTLARTAAGKLSIVGTTPMLQLGGTSASFPAWKRSSATMMCRLADDSGYAELDVATIHPASTFDFRLKQNSVDVIFSKESTAVNNTLWLEAGKMGIGVSGAPVAKFQVVDGSGNFIASNNSFGSDWIVLTNDTALTSTKYFLAESNSLGTILNARSGLLLSLRIANSEQARLTTTGLGIGATASAVLHLKAGTTSASTAPLKFTSGTNMTSAEAGAVEWDGTNLYVSQTTGPTRKTFAYIDINHLTNTGDITIDGNVKPATTQCFSWNAKSKNTVYQAASDGFVVGTIANTFSLEIQTDASNPPTTIRQRFIGVTSDIGFCCPVKKGDFYKIYDVGSSAVFTDGPFWVPVGTAG